MGDNLFTITYGAKRPQPRTLYIDIETSPNLVYAWDLYRPIIGVNQIKETGTMLCFAAKWRGEDQIMFEAPWTAPFGWTGTELAHSYMVARAHDLLNEADVVVHYNGKRFDVPWLNRMFVEQGCAPPKPYKQLDLLQLARKLKFPSNKLEFVSSHLLGEGKVKHEGFGLWTAVMAGDKDARERMEAYNKQDVALLETLHDRLVHSTRNGAR